MPVDDRFYERLEPLSIETLADLTQSRLERGSRAPAVLSDADSLERAGEQTIAFCYGAEPSRTLPETGAGAVFIQEDLLDACLKSGASALIVTHPEAAFSKALGALFRPRDIFFPDSPVSAGADIHETARLAHGVVVGPGASIGPNVEIGPYAVIGPGVEIGEGTQIGGGAQLSFSIVGANVSIGANAVIGGTGFGIVETGEGLVEAPHIGRVIIGEDVRVGSVCTIDRGRLDDTVIGRATKIDNHCHIAHNVRIGERCLMAAFAGVSGSCVIGDGVMFGGRVGVGDHISVGDNARLGADAALMRDVPAGETWLGSPAKPARSFFREVATLERLSGNRKKGNK